MRPLDGLTRIKPGKPLRAFMPACDGYIFDVEAFELKIVPMNIVSASRMNWITSSGRRSCGDRF